MDAIEKFSHRLTVAIRNYERANKEKVTSLELVDGKAVATSAPRSEPKPESGDDE